MKLSDQAVGALMMALQKSLIEQSDIVPVLLEFDFQTSENEEDELMVSNPPTFEINNFIKHPGEDTEHFEEETE